MKWYRQQSEYDFVNLNGGNYTWATRQEEIEEHWDVIMDDYPEWGRVEIKGRKKLNRNDGKFNDDITWLETLNVKGNPGWMCGKADTFAFELERFWNLISAFELRRYLRRVLKDPGIYPYKWMYKQYRRPGNKDAVVMVPTKELLEISAQRIYK